MDDMLRSQLQALAPEAAVTTTIALGYLVTQIAPVSIEQLASALGVSRTQARGALAALELVGWVDRHDTSRGAAFSASPAVARLWAAMVDARIAGAREYARQAESLALLTTRKEEV